ncbi:hypothetical protein [Candidatus Parabeggiatoa sp. HSG14]|uniref:hypothetical protein n=1 Tax=Candidatus Parabeggiatoa sp. HSG14 TaxID=3055593 RepID=UPI0025A781F0|nr:hypothetical protein [Thiotrichales bacterium HSG14]
MSKTVLIVRTYKPIPDPIEISYQWAETIKQQFITNGWQVIDLGKENATAKKLEQSINDVEVVIFYGHGELDEWCGQSESILNLDNVNLLNNKKIYVMACWTTFELGKEAINNKAICYLGYYSLVKGSLIPTFYQALGQCVNKGILVMLENSCTFEQARQAMISEYNKWIDHFAIGEGSNSTEARLFAVKLRHNRDVLQLLGDKTAIL